MDPGLLKGHCKWIRALAFILVSGESPQSHHTAASTVVWDILIGSLPGEKLGPNGVPFAWRAQPAGWTVLPPSAKPDPTLVVALLDGWSTAGLDEGSEHRTV